MTVRLATVLDYAANPEKTTKSKSKYSDADYQALRDVVAYAKDGEKTERELFCEGIHCNPQTAREQFITVKEQFDKPDGIQAYHGYLSFEETDITPELAQQVGMAFAERMWGDRFQVLVTTHLNTEHLHCHFVVNSVSFRDGKRLQNKEKAWWYFRHIADEVCLEHGLSVVQNPEAYQSPRILTQKDEAGMPTRYNLARTALDEAIAMSHNLRQLEYHLSEMGYTLGSNPKRKYWTIKGKGDERPIRLHRLGEEYTKERITQRLIENRDNIDFEPFQPKTYRPKQYRLRTRSDRIGKVGGLYGLYLYYCYRLGYLPKYKAGQQNHARVHYLFKEDLMKIDELTKQVTLLGKHHIGTDEQLFSYQHSVEEQIKTITADRTHLRNEIRKVNITDAELSQAKASISLLTEKLKELRKEVKLCQDIATRSKVIEESWMLSEQRKKNQNERRTATMNNGGDAAEQVVRLSLEGFEVAAKLTGSAAKNVALLLVSVLKQEQQTKGKARLTNMIKSGKELKVFSIPNKDLAQFTKQAKRYGVLYCVLRDKSAKGDDVPVDIIARAEDASKIQRIVERFEIGKVDKAGVITQAEQDKADREAVAREVPTKTKGEIIVEEAMGKPLQKEGQSHENPTVAKTEKSPPSERSSEISGTATDRGTAKQADKKPSVREKLERYKVAAKADKEADRAEPALSKEKSKTPEPNRQTVHTQPKKHKKSKER